MMGTVPGGVVGLSGWRIESYAQKCVRAAARWTVDDGWRRAWLLVNQLLLLMVRRSPLSLRQTWLPRVAVTTSDTPLLGTGGWPR